MPTALATLLTDVANNCQRQLTEASVYLGLQFEGIQSSMEEKVKYGSRMLKQLIALK